MQKLHLVGFTTELDGLILSTRKGAKSGGYVVALDDKTLASIDEARRRQNGDPGSPHEPEQLGSRRPPADVAPPKPSSSLSPREIQARLRAGASVAEIAAAAGVDEEWVLRFATPIRAEQARVVDRALRLSFTKPRLGLSMSPLGESVKANLTERGLRLLDDVFDAGWTAYNLHGTTWAVQFVFVNRSRVRTAVWQVDLREGQVTARGRLAADLGYVEPGRKPPRPESLEGEPVPVSPAPAPAPAPARGGTSAPRPPAEGKGGAGTAAPARTGPTPAAARPGSLGDERPTHLARPPSPMSSTNRVPLQPGRMAGAPSLRSPAPPPRGAQAPPAAPVQPKALPVAGKASSERPAETFSPKPPPARPPRAAATTTARRGRSAPVRPVPTIPAMAVPPVIEVTPGDPEPAVVVLSAPKAPRRARAGGRD